jgi:tight adherence protein B
VVTARAVVRRSLRLVPMVALALLSLTGASVAGASGTASLRSVDNREFPLVRVTVATSQSTDLKLGDVIVTENGLPVRVESVDPLGGSGRNVDAVLAIDVSNSMRGPKLQTALAAARTFVRGVPDSIPVGLVSFAGTPVVRSPVSSDRGAVELAVDSLTATTAQGTALYDSIVKASEMFSGSAQHNLILLTDGRCRATPTGQGPCTLSGSLDGAVQAARDAGVTVYTIALAGSRSNEGGLQELAARTGGRYEAITPDQLQDVYAGLATELSHQFVISYRSKAPYGVPVSLEISMPFGLVKTRFLTPSLSTLTGQTPAEVGQPPRTDPLTSDAGVAVVAGLSFFAFLSMLLLLQDLRNRKRRERQLRSRLLAEPGAASSTDPFETPANPWIPGAIADVAERTVASTRAAGVVKRRLTQADWNLRLGEFVALVFAAAVLTAGAGFYFFGTVGLLLGFIGASAPLVGLSTMATRRLSALQSQLADTLMVIASSLRAGHSFLQSLDTATKEIGEPGATEFGRTMSEIRFGRDVDEALDALVERIGSKDLEWAVTAMKIQRKIGGNLAEVLEGVAKTIRERDTLRRQVKVLSAEGRISSIILTVLPILLAVYLSIVNPDYLHVLTESRTGILILGGACGLMVIGYLWMQRIVRLDDV